MTGALFIYMTAPSLDEAKRIARAVVEERLAACANIIPQVLSVYRWQEKIEEGQEAVVILKTREELYPALEKRLKALSSYDAPCIAAVPLAAVESGFLAWIQDETNPENTER